MALPKRFPEREEISAVRAEAEKAEPGESLDEEHRVAGRVMARREMGKLTFLDLVDRSGRIQLISSEKVDLDLGDIVGVTGKPGRSRRGEPSLDGHEPRAAREDPPAAAGHLPRRHRRRDALPAALPRPAHERGVARARADAREDRRRRPRLPRRRGLPRGRDADPPAALRRWVRGAVRHAIERARRFDLYLRIADELYLKRLIVGGLEKVYELSKDFRNESISYKHSPEFTQVEWYEAYADYRDTMERTEALVAAAADAVGTTKVTFRGHDIDLSPPWQRVKFVEALESRGVWSRDEAELRAKLQEAGVDTERDRSWSQLADHAYSHFVEPELIQPTIVHDWPIELSPFARTTDEDETLVERFECVVAGMEFANAFSELNDAEEQEQRFAMQEAEREAGAEESRARRPGLRRGALVRDAADRRVRGRDRPVDDGADGERRDPRRHPLPGASFPVTPERRYALDALLDALGLPSRRVGARGRHSPRRGLRALDPGARAGHGRRRARPPAAPGGAAGSARRRAGRESRPGAARLPGRRALPGRAHTRRRPPRGRRVPRGTAPARGRCRAPFSGAAARGLGVPAGRVRPAGSGLPARADGAALDLLLPRSPGRSARRLPEALPAGAAEGARAGGGRRPRGRVARVIPGPRPRGRHRRGSAAARRRPGPAPPLPAQRPGSARGRAARGGPALRLEHRLGAAAGPAGGNAVPVPAVGRRAPRARRVGAAARRDGRVARRGAVRRPWTPIAASRLRSRPSSRLRSTAAPSRSSGTRRRTTHASRAATTASTRACSNGSTSTAAGPAPPRRCSTAGRLAAASGRGVRPATR